MNYLGDAHEELAKMVVAETSHKGLSRLAYEKAKAYSRHA